MKKKILTGIAAVIIVLGVPSTMLAAEKKDATPIEYVSALGKATMYANQMHMSKKALYEQLISEYGEQFTEDAADYAVEKVKANWKENALNKAKMYQSQMNMSRKAIYDQLISEYGENFTKEEADYALEHLPK